MSHYPRRASRQAPPAEHKRHKYPPPSWVRHRMRGRGQVRWRMPRCEGGACGATTLRRRTAAPPTPSSPLLALPPLAGWLAAAGRGQSSGPMNASSAHRQSRNQNWDVLNATGCREDRLRERQVRRARHKEKLPSTAIGRIVIVPAVVFDLFDGLLDGASTGTGISLVAASGRECTGRWGGPCR